LSIIARTFGFVIPIKNIAYSIPIKYYIQNKLTSFSILSFVVEVLILLYYVFLYKRFIDIHKL
jgi:ABC-type uncharacterized transport system permease subunit